MDPLEPNLSNRDLSAFADGELDATATRRLLRHLLDHPAAVDRLREYQQLSIAARRAVGGITPPPSDALRARLSQIGSPPANDTAPPRLNVRRNPWIGLGRSAVAASLLLGGIAVGYRAARPAAPIGPVARTAEVLPASVVARAEQVHAECSRLAMRLHAGGYPADVAGLAASVERDLGSTNPYPDLRPIGFRFRGAGPCGHPLADTAHLLYRSDRPESDAAVSVFVQPWHDQYPLAAGRLYTVSVAQTPFPMLAWRTDRVVYFLLADDQATERAAVALIRATPATGPATTAR